MGQLEDGLNDLKEIRSIMERSSQFLSLSGLSGVAAGTTALLGTAAAQWYLVSVGLTLNDRAARTFLIADGVAVLLAAAALSILFSYQMAVRRKLPFWAPIARDVLENLLVPFLAGGVFIILLINSGKMDLVPGAALIFYGLALFAASRLTVRDLRQLGILQILLGLLAAAFPALALPLWGFGFGVLHVAYGILMYRKYER